MKCKWCDFETESWGRLRAHAGDHPEGRAALDAIATEFRDLDAPSGVDAAEEFLAESEDPTEVV